MFFSTYVLTKKGPLAKVWLAAHWDKKLTKNEIRVIDLSQTVLQIVKPAVPIALRTSGELMLGVVRIYSLKVKHVQKDAIEVTQYLLRPTLVPGAAGAALLSAKGLGELMLKGKEGASGAVTMDIMVGRSAIDQLCEADFSEIADILNGAKKSFIEPTGAAWFAAESSQFLDEHRVHTQDDITKLPSDLDTFNRMMNQQRDQSSGSSKSKSSLSSVEAARAAADPLGGLGLEFPLALPEDDLMLLPPPDGGDARLSIGGDVFGDLRVPIADDEAAVAAKRKIKIVNVLDTKETTISREQLQRMQENRNDIVCAERRHGPLDDEEAANRVLLRTAESSVNSCFAAPLAAVSNKGLIAVFEAALQATVKAAADEVEAARASASVAERPTVRAFQDDAADLQVPPLPPMEDLGFDYPEEPVAPTSRKRTRDEPETSSPTGFSASTVATLERLRGILSKNTKSITFSAFTQSKKRVEVARTFVDVLVLASHGRVTVSQRDPHGEIVLQKTDKMTEALPSA